MKPQTLAFCAVTAAMLCAVAPLALPLGPVPVTLATLMIFIIAGCTKPSIAFTATLVYILLGAFGLPVFSGFAGGFQIVSGITGGFIIGYLPCVCAASVLIKRFENKKFIYPLSMLTGTALCYICGTSWYILQTGAGIISALTVCVLPFIAGDVIKIAVASMVCITVRPRLKTYITNKKG